MIHLRRNLKRKLSKAVYRRVSEALFRLRHAEDEQEGRQIFEAMVQLVQEVDNKYAKHLGKVVEHYINFLKYPKELTNPVEGLNAGLELMRLEMGGYFPSLDCLEVNLFVQAVNLEGHWQRKPMPKVVGYAYELRQMWMLRYGLNEDENLD